VGDRFVVDGYAMLLYHGLALDGQSWSELARRATGNANDAEAVANLNGFDLRTAPTAGMLVKLPEEVVRD
jgi:hypothetical protein